MIQQQKKQSPLMASIHLGRRKEPRRVMVYGQHGVGKSSFAACAEKPIFIPTEDGLADLDVASFPLATKYSDVIDAIGALYESEHDFKTVVVDSVDWLERLIWAKVCGDRKVDNIEDIAYAKGYAFAMTHWRQVLEGLSALRNDRGMTVILLAHAAIERFNDPAHDPYDRYAPKVHKHASAIVQEWCDEVLFATWKVFTKSKEEGFGKTLTKGIGTGERVMRTTERPSHVAKNRLSLPDEMPLDWAAYRAAVDGTPQATPQQEAKATRPAKAGRDEVPVGIE